jgi:hypothetical protein
MKISVFKPYLQYLSSSLKEHKGMLKKVIVDNIKRYIEHDQLVNIVK